MPRYSFECEDCETCVDISLPIDERDSVIGCPTCSGLLIRQFEPICAVIRGQGDRLTLSEMKELKMLKGAIRHKNWLESAPIQKKIAEGRMEVETRGPKELIPKLPTVRRLA